MQNLKGNWNEIAGKLKMRAGCLTDADLRFEEGKERELMRKIQLKLGKSEEQIREMIARF